MNKLRDSAKIGFHIDETSIVPNEDFLWKDIVAIHEYIKTCAERCNAFQDIIEKQDIEIDKLKRHVSNRVQKVEIVGFPLDKFFETALKYKPQSEIKRKFQID